VFLRFWSYDFFFLVSHLRMLRPWVWSSGYVFLLMVACFGIFAMCVVIEVVGFGRRWCCCDLSQFFIWMLIPDVVGFCHGEWFPVCLSWYPLA